MFMDFTACVCLITQLQVDSIVAGAGFFIFDPRFNLAKFLMAFISMCFDFTMLMQYFVIYPEASRSINKGTSEPLISK